MYKLKLYVFRQLYISVVKMHSVSIILTIIHKRLRLRFLSFYIKM